MCHNYLHNYPVYLRVVWLVSTDITTQNIVINGAMKVDWLMLQGIFALSGSVITRQLLGVINNPSFTVYWPIWHIAMYQQQLTIN